MTNLQVSQCQEDLMLADAMTSPYLLLIVISHELQTSGLQNYETLQG